MYLKCDISCGAKDKEAQGKKSMFTEINCHWKLSLTSSCAISFEVSVANELATWVERPDQQRRFQNQVINQAKNYLS